MFQPIRRRTKYLFYLWREGLWGRWVTFAWAVVYAAFSAWRSELVKSSLQDRYQIPAMLEHIPLWWGALILVALIVAWIFEASFRVHKKQGDRITVLEKETLSLREQMAPKLSVVFDEKEPYIVSIGPDDRPPEELISVRVENIGSSNLEQCKIRLKYGASGSRSSEIFGSTLCCKPFSLMPEEPALIPVLSAPHPHPNFPNERDHLSVVSFKDTEDGWTEWRDGVLLPGEHKIIIEAFSANSMRCTRELVAFYENHRWAVRNAD